jgi:hypothetical protein
MAPSGSPHQPPGGTTPEDVALWGFPPDAGAYADGVSYFQDGMAAVTVSFPGNRPSLSQLVRCHGENDWHPVPPQGLLPIDLDANRDLAEQLLGKTLGPARVIEARGSRGTSADGTDLYNLELELEVVPPFPVNLKLLKQCQAWYQIHSGVKVLMRTHARAAPSED